MKPESSIPPKRRAWLALLLGVVALTGLFFASILAEPTLIFFAVKSMAAEPRSGARVWANSNAWLASIGVCCLALLAIGYIAKKLSPTRSWVAPITLLGIVIAYVVFAQFPSTQSFLRLALWAITLPASLAIGAWPGSRAKDAL